MKRPPRPARLSSPMAVVAVVALLATACGGSDDQGAIEIDLTSPRTPRQIDPDTRTMDLAEVDGPADFTVRLPARTITGRFRSVTLYGPVTLDDSVPEDDPARSIGTLDLRYEFTDDAETVLDRIDGVVADFDVAPDDRAALDAFAERVRTTVAARDGEIDAGDFEQPTGSLIYEFPVVETAADGVSLQVSFLGGSDVAMTLFVGFDNGLG